MNLAKTAQIKEIADIIVVAINAARTAGADNALQLSVLKERLFDEELVSTSDRKEVLQKVNAKLGTQYSFNMVRNAKRIDRGVQDLQNAQGVVVVNELTGSVEVPVKLEVAPNDAPAAQDEPLLPIGPADGEGAKSPTEWELPAGAANVKPQTTKTVTEETDMNAQAQQTVVDQLALIGFKSVKSRVALLAAFLEANAEAEIVFGELPANPTADQKLNVLENPAALFVFIETNYKDGAVPMNEAERAEAASKWKKANQRDSDIDSTWIGVGGALVGGALTMMRQGEITLGNLVGTGVGAVGAYFLSDKFDDKIESEFGRYTAAGAIGLALGSLGAGLIGKAIDGVSHVTLVGQAGEVIALEQAPSLPSRTGENVATFSLPGI